MMAGELNANLLNRIATPVDNYNNMVAGNQAVEMNTLNMENKAKAAMTAEASARMKKIAGVLQSAKGDPVKWKQATEYLRNNEGIEFDPGEDDMANADFLIGSTISAADQIKNGIEADKLDLGQYNAQTSRMTAETNRANAGQPKASDKVVTDIDGQRGILDKTTGEFTPKGKSPIRGKPGLSPTEFKAKRESETDLLNLEQTLTSLGEALGLADNVFEGAGAEAMTYIGAKVPGGGYLVDADKANKTASYSSIMSPEAIKTMADTLKGATTDFELRKFETILSDPSQPNNIKKQVITRMLNLAKNKHELETKRLQEFDARENSGQTPAASEQSGQAEPGEIPTQAVEELLADPSGAAEFDEVFGEGAAAQVLGQ